MTLTINITDKECQDCNKTKPIEEFPTHKKSYCNSCAIKRVQKRQREHLSYGTCRVCGMPLLPYSTSYCERCFLKRKTYCAIGSYKRVDEVIALAKEQKFCCFYTGRPLTQGINFSLDHYFSRMERPDLIDDIQNVVLCDSYVNNVKNTLNGDTFVERLKDGAYFFDVVIRAELAEKEKRERMENI